MTRRNMVLVALLWLALMSARADVWNRDTVYTERVTALQAAITAKPNDANALVDLAAFYLKPLAPRTVEAADGTVRTFNVPLRNEIIPEGIKNTYAVPWVFRGDTSAAWPLLTKALAIDPRNVLVAREMAMYYRMRGDLDWQAQDARCDAIGPLRRRSTCSGSESWRRPRARRPPDSARTPRISTRSTTW